MLNRVNDLETSIRVLVDSPLYVHDDIVGFNGVRGRKKIFNEILNTYSFHHIIETGTYLGDTSGYMTTTSGVPVLTCELNQSLYRIAKMRLKHISSISLHNMDSRAFLMHLSNNTGITKKCCFIYLDAHWGKDIPLREEIMIIASNWDEFVIMIDDFKVPGDDGYAHDNYGTLEYINMPHLRRQYNLRAYFPSMPSTEEPTQPTGCVVMAKKNSFGERLDEVMSLRRYDL